MGCLNTPNVRKGVERREPTNESREVGDSTSAEHQAVRRQLNQFNKRRKEMRTIRNVVPVAITMGFFALSLLFVGSAAMAVGPDTDQLIHDGKVVGMTGTTVQIKEWAGTYSYRLSPTGRQALDVARVRVGDDVRFTASSPWGIAYDFSLRKHDASPAAYRGSKRMDRTRSPNSAARKSNLELSSYAADRTALSIVPTCSASSFSRDPLDRKYAGPTVVGPLPERPPFSPGP